MNKKDFLWNMIGSGLYAAVTFIFTALANWLTDSVSAGFFAMTFTTALMMQPLGIFEVRPFQVTDVRFKYQFAHYFSFRLVTCCLFLMAGMVYGFITADGAGMFIAVMMVFLFKSVDCVGDVFEGEFQRRERMDIAGKSLAYRMVLVIAAYCITIALTKNILAAVTVTAGAAFVGFFLFDIRWMRRFSGIKLEFSSDQVRAILQDCLVLCLSSLMCSYTWNCSKYAVEAVMGNQVATISYNMLMMPTLAINLVSGIIFKPLLTSLALKYAQGRIKEFYGVIRKLLLGIGLLTGAALAGAFLLGIPVLSLLTPYSLSGYRGVLLVLVLGSGFTAVTVILYYVLTVMRRQYLIFFGYLFVFLPSLVIPKMLTETAGFWGAASSYAGLMALQCIVFYGMIRHTSRKRGVPDETDS